MNHFFAKRHLGSGVSSVIPAFNRFAILSSKGTDLSISSVEKPISSPTRSLGAQVAISAEQAHARKKTLGFGLGF